MARISTAIWEDPEWRALTAPAQTVGIACMVFGVSGPITTPRLVRKTGWTAGYIEEAAAELRDSAYAHILAGREHRRTLPAALRAVVFTRDGFSCRRCGSSEQLSVDHIIPVSRAGTDDLDNLQTLCQPCNNKKGNR